MMFYVYILQSELNNRYYIGSTIDVEKRVEKHNKGYVSSTKNMRPWKLVFFQGFATSHEAKRIEYRLKKLKRRDYIEKIIKEQMIRMK